MEPRMSPTAPARPDTAERSDVWVRCVMHGLRSGQIRLDEAEAAVVPGLTHDDAAVRAVAESCALALCRGSETGQRRPPRNTWPGILADPFEIPADAPSRPRGRRATPEEHEAKARALVTQLPTGHYRRLEAVNLRPKLYRGAAIARAFLAEALAVLPGDPQASSDWAALAELAAGTSSSRRPPGEDPGELEVLAFRAELYKGNAQRALGHFARAEETLCGAVIGARHSGIQDLRFWAEAKAFRASLRSAQRRFGEAIQQGMLAALLFRELGEHRWQVTQQWQLAAIHEQMGDHRSALSAIRKAIPGMKEITDPRLDLGVRQMELTALVRCGLFVEAQALLDLLAAHYVKYPEERPRQLWNAGLVAAGLGRPSDAESHFRNSRDTFLAVRNAYDAALVSLDWSLFLLDQNRPEEVLPLAVSMGQAFEALGVARETLASWAIFQTAAERRELTRAVAESMVRTLGEERAGPKPGL
jgi:tetratricopeptide (TPR) repeat protein